MKKRFTLLLVILIVTLITAMLFSIAVGSVKIPIGDTINYIKSWINNIFSSSEDFLLESESFIIINLRMPRVLMAIIVGAILSIAGLMYQAIFKNPMAEPYCLGISSGAALGATIGIVFLNAMNISSISIVSLCAFIGSIITSFLVYKLAGNNKKLNTTYLLLAGIVMSSIFSAIMSIIMLFNKDDLARVYLWTMGSFRAVSWNQVLLVTPIFIIGLIILANYYKELNAISMGDKEALSLGIDVNKVNKILIVLSSILISVAVSNNGIIGFVGLIVPHFLRIIIGPNHKYLIPLSIVCGALFMLVSDTIARTIITNVDLPVGVITALFGGPFFLALLIKEKRKSER